MSLVVRTVIEGVQGSPWLSTMHFGGTGQTHADSAVGHVAAFWTAVDNVMSSLATWRTLPDVEELATNGSLIAIFQTTPQTGNGADGGQLIQGIQGLIRWRTGQIVGGREVRGRTFIPAVTELGNDNSGPTSAYITAVGNAAATLNNATNPALVIRSRTHSVIPVVVAASVSPTWSWLRSRRD